MEALEGVVNTLGDYAGVSVPSINAPLGIAGSSGFRKNNKLFAMITPKGRFAVKLPRKRAKELVGRGIGEHFDPNQGWLMREWFVLDPAYHERWLSLAVEAMDYVSSQG